MKGGGRPNPQTQNKGGGNSLLTRPQPQTQTQNFGHSGQGLYKQSVTTYIHVTSYVTANRPFR